MTGPLGITGSTGNLGGRVARLLAAAGVEQRLVVRDADTGRLLARVRSLDRRYVWMSFDTWEPDGSIVIDLSQVGTETQMRCAPDLRRCERVRRPSGQLVQAVAAAAGTPVSAS